MKHIFHVLARTTALALAICLLVPAACPVARAAADAAVLKRAVAIIAQMETNANYGGVSNDTNGAPSIGILQWNDARGVRLLKSIINEDADTAKELLGASLYKEIVGGSNSVWSGRKLSSSERSAIASLLKTEIGKAKQDALARADVTGYIETAMNYGMRDKNALVYYADIAHQVGGGAAKKYHVKAAAIAGGYAKITLKDMYQAALVYATYTKSRRVKVYNLLVANPVSSEDPQTPETPETPETTAAPTKIRFAKKSVSMVAGAAETLAYTFTPSGARSGLTWKSSNRLVATVSEDGVVTAVKPGRATITVVTQNKKKATCKITVKAIRVSSVRLSGETAMSIGASQTLTATVLPENATNQKLQWRSGNTRIATVSQSGVVRARRRGTVKIYCRAKENKKKIATIRITISDR